MISERCTKLFFNSQSREFYECLSCGISKSAFLSISTWLVRGVPIRTTVFDFVAVAVFFGRCSIVGCVCEAEMWILTNFLLILKISGRFVEVHVSASHTWLVVLHLPRNAAAVIKSKTVVFIGLSCTFYGIINFFRSWKLSNLFMFDIVNHKYVTDFVQIKIKHCGEEEKNYCKRFKKLR